MKYCKKIEWLIIAFYLTLPTVQMELFEIKEKDIGLYKKTKERILNSKAFREKYFKKNFYTFCLYYFTNTFTFESADFQKDFCKDLQEELNILFQGFRESWKTVYFKYFFIYCIVYKRKRFMHLIAFDKLKAKSKLYDIVNHLQTNRKILNDFWQLFYQENKTEKKSEKKSIEEFITTNSVKCRAIWIGTSIRWDVYWCADWEFRPDFVWLDDIDTIASTNTLELIHKNYTLVKSELFWWFADDVQIIFLFNTIKFDWVWPRLWKDYKNNKKWKLKKVYYDPDNNVWPIRLTPEYIEDKKELLWEKSFNANFLWIAETVWSPVFDINTVKELKVWEYKTPTKYKELRIYKEPSNYNMYWVDTSWWSIDWDNASLIIRDFTTYELLACYYWHIQPDILCDVIDVLQKLWYTWIVWIERNNTWIATLKKAESYSWYYQLYKEETVDKITNRKTHKYWWHTNLKTRPLMISEYEEAIRTKVITDVDERWQEEMYWFVYNDNSRPEAQLWFHDDYIIWDCICWQMRNTRRLIQFN